MYAKMSASVVRQFLKKSGRTVFQDTFALFGGNLSSCSLWNSQVQLKCSKKDDLGQSTIILQDGSDIQELPVIVRKVKDVGIISVHECKASVKEKGNSEAKSFKSVKEDRELDAETHEIIEGFNRCFTAKGVFLLLDTIPDDEVTPCVALHALKKIVELENNQEYRNVATRSNEDVPENFTRTAIFNQLIDKIISGPDSEVVLDCLKIVSRDMFGGSVAVYRDKLCNEVLIRVTDGKYNIQQVCKIVRIISSFMQLKKCVETVDKLWVGVVDKGKEINEKNLVEVFRILTFFKQSQKLVFNILEKRIKVIWWRLSGSDVAEILSILFEVKISSPRTLSILAHWTNTNIHTVSEDDLLEIVTGFCAHDYADKEITKALERYVKAKSHKVKNSSVLAAVMDYCARFRICSPVIFSKCEEYFIQHASKLSSLSVKALFVPFGLMYYQPLDGVKFWQTVENVLESKFVQFRPDDAIDIMLACVYLEKYPLNFVRKIFNPYFLDRLHSFSDVNLLRQMRMKLKLFDTAMTLECQQYRGPMLPKDHSAKALWQDGRIRRMANYIVDPLSHIIGGVDRVTTSVILPQLPTIELYIVDIMLHPDGMGKSLIRMNFGREPNVYVALLIHVPEHYCLYEDRLVGPQIMRKRHFRKLGMKVVDLKYDVLTRLKVHPKALHRYLEECMQHAEDAL